MLGRKFRPNHQKCPGKNKRSKEKNEEKKLDEGGKRRQENVGRRKEGGRSRKGGCEFTSTTTIKKTNIFNNASRLRSSSLCTSPRVPR
jgi:hypothetical protein